MPGKTGDYPFFFFSLLARTIPKPAIPVNPRNPAHFKEIIGDIVRISIGKRAAKKSTFLAFLLTKTELVWFLSVYPVRNMHSLFLMGLNPRLIKNPSFAGFTNGTLQNGPATVDEASVDACIKQRFGQRRQSWQKHNLC